MMLFEHQYYTLHICGYFIFALPFIQRDLVETQKLLNESKINKRRVRRVLNVKNYIKTFEKSMLNLLTVILNEFEIVTMMINIKYQTNARYNTTKIGDKNLQQQKDKR